MIHILLPLIVIFLLSLIADWAICHSLKKLSQHNEARVAKISDHGTSHHIRRSRSRLYYHIALTLAIATHLYLLAYIIVLILSPARVMPAPILTLTALILFVPKATFGILWLVTVLPARRHRLSGYTFVVAAGVATALAALIFYGGVWGRWAVSINRVTVSSARLPRSFDGYRIAQISDLHLGSLTEADTAFVHAVADSLLALRPDVICFTGDLVNVRAEEARPYIHILRRLRTRRHRVFAVMGNHDYADYAHDLTSDSARHADADTLRALIAQADWTLLDNRAWRIRHRSFRSPADPYDPADELCIMGVGNIGEPPFNTYGDLDAALAEMPHLQTDSTFTILLSHNPSHWRQEVLPHTDIDLTLSGHTHGMQIKIGNFSPARWRYTEWGGLYREGDQYLYVNTGLGTVGMPVRIGLAPEITLITLRCEPTKQKN